MKFHAGAGLVQMVVHIGFGVKENNYLGKGINLNTNLKLQKIVLKGKFFIFKSKF